MTAAEKKAAKTEKDKAEEKYTYCTLDGRKEKVGNFRIEPPGLFRGRGEHPRKGALKVIVSRASRCIFLINNLDSFVSTQRTLPSISARACPSLNRTCRASGRRLSMTKLSLGWLIGRRTSMVNTSTYSLPPDLLSRARVICRSSRSHGS